MFPIATSKKACGKKEQGFEKENTTAIESQSKTVGVWRFCFYKFTNEAKAKVLTLSFVEQANTFAVGSRKKIGKRISYKYFAIILLSYFFLWKLLSIAQLVYKHS